MAQIVDAVAGQRGDHERMRERKPVVGRLRQRQ